MLEVKGGKIPHSSFISFSWQNDSHVLHEVNLFFSLSYLFIQRIEEFDRAGASHIVSPQAVVSKETCTTAT